MDYPGTHSSTTSFGVSRGTASSQTPAPKKAPFVVSDHGSAGSLSVLGVKPDRVQNNTYAGYFADEVSAIKEWFEHFHVIRRRFDLGNILTKQTIPIEVYSAFRDDSHVWTGLVNNAGDGVDLLGDPPLPTVVKPQTGIVMSLEFDTSGDPNVDSTLDFVFDSGTTPVPITLQRVVLFHLQPEAGYTEFLEFLTQVFAHEDGTEQRASLRKNPRQFYEWRVITEDGPERSLLENTLFEWQTRVFGIGVWDQLTRTTFAATAGDLTVNVQSTSFRDFREEELVLIYANGVLNDVATIETGGIGATTITLKTGLDNNYPVGVFVLPLRTAVVVGQTQGKRYPSGAQELIIKFRVTDNDIDIADTSAFGSFNSKVLIDGNNAIKSTMSESFTQDITILDNKTGIVYQTSPWTNNKRISAKTFFAANLQAQWEVRQLLHALRGRQVSFYLPTFAEDLTPVADLVSGLAALSIQNVGYTQFVVQRQPRNVIRVTFKDGSTPLLRTITGSVIDSPTQESLTLDGNWPATYTVDEIDKIMFVEKVRFDSDKIKIKHNINQQTARIQAPVKVVLE